MSNFYDDQLDYFKKSAARALIPTIELFREEAFLYLPQGPPFHFCQGEEFPEEANFAEELLESYRRRKAVGAIFRIQVSIQASWPLPDSESVDDNVRDASLIVLVHPQARLLTAAADVKEVAPHEVQQVKDREGNPIEGRSSTPKGPRLSGWVEVALSDVPSAFRNLEFMK